MKKIVTEVIEAAGGTGNLAKQLGIKHQAIYQWKQIPVHRVIEIEKLTGIPRDRLRPDLYEVV